MHTVKCREMNSGNIGDGASVAPQMFEVGGKAGENKDSISFSVAELTRDGVRHVVGVTASCREKVPPPIASINVAGVSTSCRPVRQAQEQRSVSGLGNDGPVLGFCASFPTVPLAVGFKTHGGGTSVTATSVSLPCQPKVEVIEGQGAGPSFHPPERVSQFANAHVGEGSHASTWLQAPQGRGKAVVRRGRPRLWSAENREAVCKRVKIEELYGDASPSMELTVFNTPPPAQNPFFQGGMEKFADEEHATTVLEPALLACMSAVAPLPETSAAAENERSPMTVSSLEGGAEIPVMVPERSPSVTRCGGITLNGNQCTHNVKDGSGFCVKHTKVTDVCHSKRTDLEGPGGSQRRVTYTPFKATDMIVFRCRGKTLNGNQCTHNVKDGAVYCLKHGDQAWGPPPIKRIEERAFHQTPAFPVPYGMPYQTPTHTYSQTPYQKFSQIPPQMPARVPAQVPAQVRSAQIPVQVPARVPAQAPLRIPVQTQAPNMAPPSPEEDDDGGEVPRCVGRTRRTEEQCSFRPKSGSLFCERHSLSASLSLKRRRSREVMNMGDTISTRETRSVSKAKDLFSDILNAGLLHGKAVSTNGKELVGWVCQEATKDAGSAEALLGYLSEEMGKLRNVIIEDRKKSSVAKPPNFWQTKYSPNLARSYSECVKGNKKDAVQRSASGRFSSDARGTFESWPSTTQMVRQGSEPNRDILACALCTRKFPEIPSLARHWKDDHKKEASLFQKGMACCECGQEYTNRGGLLRHWRSTHPTLLINELGVIVCMICDAMFKDFSMLWMHVEDQHSLEFSSADFAQRVREGILRAGNAMKCSVCGEEFDTELECSNHKASAHNGFLSSDAVDNSPTSGNGNAANGNGASSSKFKCKFCGQRFKLLPDLGRHHQAEHRKPSTKISTTTQVKLPPLVKRTPLPNPEAASSPLGKTLPLSELFIPQSSFEIAEQGEHQSSVPVAMESPSHMPVGAAQPQTFNFRHLKTIAREKRKMEETNVDASTVPAPILPPFLPLVLPPVPPPVPSPFAPPAPPPAPSAPVIAPKERWGRPKRMESLQNDNLVPMKKRLGRPPKQAMQIVQHMKAVQHSQQERIYSNVQPAAFRTVDGSVKAVSKMPLQRASNTTGWPSSSEILDAARVACCKDSMYRELAKKHNNLHPNLHLQASSLLTAIGTDIQWLADTFLCPNQCSPFHGMAAALPALDVDMAGFSEAPFKSEADHFNYKGPIILETINIKDVIKGKHIVMHEDLSNGQEPVPIPCVIDEDVLRPCSCASCRENIANTLDIAEPWKCFNYINKRLLDPSLGLDTESSKLGCSCGERRCNPGQCDHVMMFDNDNAEACDKFGVAIRGRFPYDEQGRIILEEGYMVYECNSSCHCWEDCRNRVLQKGVRVKLEVFKSRHKGWAVRTAQPIRSGTFVCEYIGEVVNDREANQRGVRYDQDGCSYLYDIDAHLDVTGSRAGAKPFVIDATKHGNVARFINHSCAPNLINYEVLVESMDCQLAHIGFFACRDIGVGEELAYDYRYKLLPGKGTACHCGAAACRGRLY